MVSVLLSDLRCAFCYMLHVVVDVLAITYDVELVAGFVFDRGVFELCFQCLYDTSTQRIILVIYCATVSYIIYSSITFE